MSLDIHPSAITNFNAKALEIVSLVKEITRIQPINKTFPSDLHVYASISETDIIGEPEEAATNYRGRTIERFFRFNQKKYGLDEPVYVKVIELAEKIQKKTSVQSKLSTSFLENTIFEWIKTKFCNSEYKSTFIEYLAEQASHSIQKMTLWTPVAWLEVETNIPISKSEFRPLSKDVINQWENKLATNDSDRLKLRPIFDELRTKYQGLAAVVTTIEAEPVRATEIAREEAELATSIMGIFSDATIVPDIKCFSKVKGSENVAISTTLIEPIERNFQIYTSNLDDASPRHWRLDNNAITDIRSTLLDDISKLLTSDSLNEFQEAVINSTIIYSKSAFTSDPVEKLIYMLSSLESILLKNDNEPIQQNLAERLAMFIGNDLDQRKQIIKIVKDVYAIRSKYLHHGHSYSDMALLSKFMSNVWTFFVYLYKNVEFFDKKIAFVSAIDDRKLA